MKLDSKYFDSIRVGARRRGPERAARTSCDWKGCSAVGAHRAPRGRGQEGKFYLFCVEHIRMYNASYNYFEGMSSVEVESFQKDALTGHRPTWKLGGAGSAENIGAASGISSADSSETEARARDPHGFFAWRARQAREVPKEHRRKLRPLEKKSLDALRLPAAATKTEIKTRFKELVKLHHPDLHGGDSQSEDKLREIIQAYNHLKQAGLV